MWNILVLSIIICSSNVICTPTSKDYAINTNDTQEIQSKVSALTLELAPEVRPHSEFQTTISLLLFILHPASSETHQFAHPDEDEGQTTINHTTVEDESRNYDITEGTPLPIAGQQEIWTTEDGTNYPSVELFNTTETTSTEELETASTTDLSTQSTVTTEVHDLEETTLTNLWSTVGSTMSTEVEATDDLDQNLEVIRPKQLTSADEAEELVVGPGSSSFESKQGRRATPRDPGTLRNRATCNERPVIRSCHSVNKPNRLSPREAEPTTWYYDPVELTCHYTTDCIVNGNAFQSRQDCEEMCMPQSGVEKCIAPPKAGYFQCSSHTQVQAGHAAVPILMVFFDKTTGKCRWFTYYGCGGTANRFHSIAECESTCTELVASEIFIISSELCRAPPSLELNKKAKTFQSNTNQLEIALDDLSTKSTQQIQGNNATALDGRLPGNLTVSQAVRVQPGCGNVGQYEPRWYLDVQTGMCREFAFSHCGGSANNFLTRTDCERFCGAKREPQTDICLLPPHSGDCGTSNRSTWWYFDPNQASKVDHDGTTTRGACREFPYSGCGGNSNRFSNIDACQMTCEHHRKTAGDSNSEVESSERENHAEQRDEEASNDQAMTTMAMEDGQKTTKSQSMTVPSRHTSQINTTITLLGIDVEPCRRPSLPGNCRPLNHSSTQSHSPQGYSLLRMQRWFFNVLTSHCEPFEYSGCSGSENTFDDAQSCRVACKARIVRPDRNRRCDSLPHHTKCYSFSPLSRAESASSTSGSSTTIVAFHFSVESATCKAFHLDTTKPGCDRGHYFADGHECLRDCVKSSPTERHLQNRCFARRTHAVGNCSGNPSQKVFRWSYLPELNQCIQFSQCHFDAEELKQPGNNFASRSICETTCMATSLEEVCQLPMDSGPCHGTQSRYYFDIKHSRCQMFLYGGCLGNLNRFISHQECQAACGEFPIHVYRQNISIANLAVRDASTNKAPQDMEASPLSTEVFERMRRITQHHTDHFPWDLCLEVHSYGTCPRFASYHHGITGHLIPTQLTRYFYDRGLGKCQPYTYTGCGACGNHFDTLQDCTRVCEQRLRNPKAARCQQANETRQCPGSSIRVWSFNHSLGDCHAMEMCPTSGLEKPTGESAISMVNTAPRIRRTSQWLGMWRTNTGLLPDGVYATRSACQYHCLPKPPRGTDAQNVCHMNPIVTVPFGCHAMETRWYFEPREATCRSYITCPQYGNNFPTESACRDVCTPTHPLHVCRLTKDHGGCSHFATRWYYNVRTRNCRAFLYGGCFGNSNRFLTKAECDGFCTNQDVCRLPLSHKNSTDVTYPKRYFYDMANRKCRQFHFTGMLAHGNNFPTLEACESTCVFVPDVEAISMEVSPENAQWIDTSDIEIGPPNNNEEFLSNEKKTSTQMNVTQGTNLNISEKELRSPCYVSGHAIGTSELTEQSMCPVEDIIQELGYRFRPIRSRLGEESGVEGVCELTLVPICLSKPKKVYGAVVDPAMRSIGRVFQTKAECEKTCLSNRRVRRSTLIDMPSETENDHVEDMIARLLEHSGSETVSFDGPPRNGCPPGQNSAEQVDRFHHSSQAFTRWPCKTDTEKTRQLIPLYERLSGRDVRLNCWIIANERPNVRWVSLKDLQSFTTSAVKIPMLNNIWSAELHLSNLDPFRYNGAWSCQATSADGVHLQEAVIQLHVVPRIHTVDAALGRGSAIEQSVVVPEGGSLILTCPGTESAEFSNGQSVTWQRVQSQGSNWVNIVLPGLTDVPLLYVPSVNATRHAGIWACRSRTSNSTDQGDIYQFMVNVARPAKFLQTPPQTKLMVSKHQRSQSLHCAQVDLGNPLGQLTWWKCLTASSVDCEQIHLAPNTPSQILKVTPSLGNHYECRVANVWGRDHQYYRFSSI